MKFVRYCFLSTLIAVATIMAILLFEFRSRNVGDSHIETSLVPSVYDIMDDECQNNQSESNTPAIAEENCDLATPYYMQFFGGKPYYGDDFDVPYGDMQYADDEVFSLLKESYGKFDFDGGYKKGDIDGYDYYREKYYLLVRSEVPFFDPGTGEVAYLNDYDDIAGYLDANNESVNCLPNSIFKYFDMDGDGEYELCIGHWYIFKYIRDSDTYILWGGRKWVYNFILGSGAVVWEHPSGFGDMYRYEHLDKEGDPTDSVSFFKTYIGHPETEETETVFIVDIPQIEKTEDRIKIPEWMLEQSYYCYYEDRMYVSFRVTEEQYYELTKDYYSAREFSDELIAEVSFTYDEMFGDFSR